MAYRIYPQYNLQGCVADLKKFIAQSNYSFTDIEGDTVTVSPKQKDTSRQVNVTVTRGSRATSGSYSKVMESGSVGIRVLDLKKFIKDVEDHGGEIESSTADSIHLKLKKDEISSPVEIGTPFKKLKSPEFHDIIFLGSTQSDHLPWLRTLSSVEITEPFEDWEELPGNYKKYRVPVTGSVKDWALDISDILDSIQTAPTSSPLVKEFKKRGVFNLLGNIGSSPGGYGSYSSRHDSWPVELIAFFFKYHDIIKKFPGEWTCQLDEKGMGMVRDLTSKSGKLTSTEAAYELIKLGVFKGAIDDDGSLITGNNPPRTSRPSSYGFSGPGDTDTPSSGDWKDVEAKVEVQRTLIFINAKGLPVYREYKKGIEMISKIVDPLWKGKLEYDIDVIGYDSFVIVIKDADKNKALVNKGVTVLKKAFPESTPKLAREYFEGDTSKSIGVVHVPAGKTYGTEAGKIVNFSSEDDLSDPGETANFSYRGPYIPYDEIIKNPSSAVEKALKLVQGGNYGGLNDLAFLISQEKLTLDSVARKLGEYRSYVSDMIDDFKAFPPSEQIGELNGYGSPTSQGYGSPTSQGYGFSALETELDAAIPSIMVGGEEAPKSLVSEVDDLLRN